MNILFVCSGNVSRSFLADMLFKHEIETHKIDNICSASAGVFASQGSPPDPKMVEFLLQKELPVKNHEARQISKQDVEWADRILVMEKEHARMIEATWPDVKEKVELLGGIASGAHIADDVIDPYGGSSYHYRLAQSQITLAIRSLVKSLT
jgi:protein-tyrosine-phosphatase